MIVCEVSLARREFSCDRGEGFARHRRGQRFDTRPGIVELCFTREPNDVKRGRGGRGKQNETAWFKMPDLMYRPR